MVSEEAARQPVHSRNMVPRKGGSTQHVPLDLEKSGLRPLRVLPLTAQVWWIQAALPVCWGLGLKGDCQFHQKQFVSRCVTEERGLETSFEVRAVFWRSKSRGSLDS